MQKITKYPSLRVLRVTHAKGATAKMTMVIMRRRLPIGGDVLTGSI